MAVLGCRSDRLNDNESRSAHAFNGANVSRAISFVDLLATSPNLVSEQRFPAIFWTQVRWQVQKGEFGAIC